MERFQPVEILGRVNRLRDDVSQSKLKLDENLSQLAQSHSDEMASSDFLSHWNTKGHRTSVRYQTEVCDFVEEIVLCWDKPPTSEENILEFTPEQMTDVIIDSINNAIEGDDDGEGSEEVSRMESQEFSAFTSIDRYHLLTNKHKTHLGIGVGVSNTAIYITLLVGSSLFVPQSYPLPPLSSNTFSIRGSVEMFQTMGVYGAVIFYDPPTQPISPEALRETFGGKYEDASAEQVGVVWPWQLKVGANLSQDREEQEDEKKEPTSEQEGENDGEGDEEMKEEGEKTEKVKRQRVVVEDGEIEIPFQLSEIKPGIYTIHLYFSKNPSSIPYSGPQTGIQLPPPVIPKASRAMMAEEEDDKEDGEGEDHPFIGACFVLQTTDAEDVFQEHEVAGTEEEEVEERENTLEEGGDVVDRIVNEVEVDSLDMLKSDGQQEEEEEDDEKVEAENIENVDHMLILDTEEMSVQTQEERIGSLREELDKLRERRTEMNRINADMQKKTSQLMSKIGWKKGSSSSSSSSSTENDDQQQNTNDGAQQENNESSLMESRTEKERQYLKVLDHIAELRDRGGREIMEFSSLSGDMQSQLEEREYKVNEIQESLRDFKRKVSRSAQNSRTGNPIPTSLINQFEVVEAQKDEDLERVRLKNINLNMTLQKLEAELAKKEQLAEGLHLIDFEQLKIENQTLNEKIEERSGELEKLKRKHTTTVQVLTHVKMKLHFVERQVGELGDHLKGQERDLTMRRDKITSAKRFRDELKRENVALKAEQGFASTDLLVVDFQQKNSKIEEIESVIEELRDRYESLTMQIELNKQEMERLKEEYGEYDDLEEVDGRLRG